eukprot:scaffold25563_cov127-Cylindrotheca_fusiformis.AAC.4
MVILLFGAISVQAPSIAFPLSPRSTEWQVVASRLRHLLHLFALVYSNTIASCISLRIGGISKEKQASSEGDPSSNSTSDREQPQLRWKNRYMSFPPRTSQRVDVRLSRPIQLLFQSRSLFVD